jgi:hypothetical protein
MLNSLFLRLIARSSDSLVAFVIALDAKLDLFLAKHDADVAGLESEIVSIVESADAKIDAIRDDADAAITDVRNAIDKAVETAEVLARLKTVLSK